MNSLSLYKISDEIAQLLDGGIDEDGVISDELGQALAMFEGKGQAVAAYILNQEATAAAIGEAIKKLAKRGESYERRAESLRQYLKFNMQKTGIYSMDAYDGTFSVKLHIDRDASVEIFDEKQIPAAYMTTPEPPAPRPDKKAIGAAIKAGWDVPGAKITKKDRLEIR